LISRGSQSDIFLFEVTEQDLLDTGGLPVRYRAGDILLFDSREHARLGQEFARADDLASAREFLKEQPTASMSAPKSESSTLNAEIELLKERISQRDGLLIDLSDELRLEREQNELLKLLLEQTEYQIELDAASRDEMIGDLEQASSEHRNATNSLERTLEEKFELEQELAERITELLDLNLQNDDLQRRLEASANKTPKETAGSAAVSDSAPGDSAPGDLALGDTLLGDLALGDGTLGDALPDSALLDTTSSRFTASDSSKIIPGQFLTMSNGKQIHIYHEFPRLPKRSIKQRLLSALAFVLRTVIVVLLAIILVFLGSALATSLANQISFGSAIDLLLRSLNLPW
jgi:hypothetical protein